MEVLGFSHLKAFGHGLLQVMATQRDFYGRRRADQLPLEFGTRPILAWLGTGQRPTLAVADVCLSPRVTSIACQRYSCRHGNETRRLSSLLILPTPTALTIGNFETLVLYVASTIRTSEHLAAVFIASECTKNR